MLDDEVTARTQPPYLHRTAIRVRVRGLRVRPPYLAQHRLYEEVRTTHEVRLAQKSGQARSESEGGMPR